MVNIAIPQPFWDLGTIQAQVRFGAFQLTNRRARQNAQMLGWKTDMIAAFLLSLKTRHFHKRYALQNAYDGLKKLDTDGYRMHFDEDERCEGRARDACFYGKLCLEKLPSGARVAIVSIHLDGQP